MLSVLFGMKLTWFSHISNAFAKVTKSLNEIKLIKRFFKNKEILMILTSGFFSILYLNIEVWLLSSLNQTNKNSC
jgi:hypothetical protein